MTNHPASTHLPKYLPTIERMEEEIGVTGVLILLAEQCRTRATNCRLAGEDGADEWSAAFYLIRKLRSEIGPLLQEDLTI